MNKLNKTNSTKDILFQIIHWIVFLFMFISFFALTPFSFTNVVLLIAGIFICPPISKLLQAKFHYKSWLKWGIFSMFVLLGILVSPTYTDDITVANTNNSNLVSDYTVSNSVSNNVESSNTNIVSTTTNNTVESQNILNTSTTTYSDTASSSKTSETSKKQDTSNSQPVTAKNASTSTQTSNSASSLASKSSNTVSGNKKENSPSSSASSSSSTSAPTSKPKETTSAYYRGETGDKYHRQSCSTLKGKGIPISLSEIQAQGRQPCKRCKP